MNSKDPYNIIYQRQRFRNSDKGEDDLGDREYQFGKAKETMVDDDKTTFNSLISAIIELTTQQK